LRKGAAVRAVAWVACRPSSSGIGIAPRYCLVTNVSAEGVRLQLNGIDVVDEFVLLFNGNELARDGTYKVVWRQGQDVGAKFIGPVS
jgi:hypothetical protein